MSAAIARREKSRTRLIERAIRLIRLFDANRYRGVRLADVERELEVNRRTAYRWMSVASDLMGLDREYRPEECVGKVGRGVVVYRLPRERE